MDQGYCNLAWLELIRTSLSSVKRRQVRIWWSHFIPASPLFLWILIFSTRDQEVWGPLGNQSVSPPICLCLSSPNSNRFAHFLRAIFWITSSIMLFLSVYKKKKPCKVLSLILRCSAIFHQPFVFSFFYQLLLCLNCSASFSQIRLVFFSFLPLIMLFLLPGVPFCTISIKIHPFTMPTSKSYLPPENPLATTSTKLPWLIRDAFVTYIQLVVLIVHIPIYTG